MCIQCVLLGALVNAGVDDVADDDGNNVNSRFRTESLSPFDFAPPNVESVRHVVDREASAYLSDTLLRLKSEAGLDLVPLQVEDDGSCLPHAVSRCLVGHEVYYDALRLDLREELRTNADWYRSVLNADADGDQIYDEEDWSELEWPRIVGACRPTYGRPAGPDRWLGPEHVLGLSNVLGRPILLLNTPEIMADVHHGQRGGLFLPLRRSRHDIMKQHGGTFPGPIVVGYSSPAANHYVALVRVRSSSGGDGGSSGGRASVPDGPLGDWWARTWGRKGGGNGDVWREFLVPCDLMRVAVPKMPLRETGAGEDDGDEERLVLARHPVTNRGVFLLPPDPTDGDGSRDGGGGTELVVDRIVPLWAVRLVRGTRDLIGKVGPRARTRTIKTLQSYVKNLLRAREDASNGKLDRLAKVSKIPLDGGAGCRWIADVPGALSVLEACGYRIHREAEARSAGGENDDGDDDGAGRCLRLAHPPVCLGLTDDGGGGGGTADDDDEERLLRLERLGEDPLAPLRHAERLLRGLGEASAKAGLSGTNGEIPGYPGTESRLLGFLPRYSWLGLGPDERVDAKTGKIKIAAWPPRSSPSSRSSLPALWEAARNHYGSGLAARPDGAWTFGAGSDSAGFCDRRLLELEARFYTLTRGAFGNFRSVVLRMRLDPTSDVIVECPSCGTECVPSLPPEALSAMTDRECVTNCPNPSCAALLDIRRTYRRCVADAVAEAARGSLGGVWRCGAAQVSTVSSDDGYGRWNAAAAAAAAPPASGGGTCRALNVGHSVRCVRCGAANPEAAAAPKARDDEGSTEERMLEMMIEMLNSSSVAGASARPKPTSVPSASPGSFEPGGREDHAEERTQQGAAASMLEFHFFETLEELSSDDEYDEDLKAAVALSLEERTVSGDASEMSVALQPQKRGKSCPMVLSVADPSQKTAKHLRVLAEPAYDEKTTSIEGQRQTSCPVTRPELEFCQRTSGLDLDSLTRTAALSLLRRQTRLRNRSVSFEPNDPKRQKS